MKKNISINISGIIFHIEEDGYDMLKGYLDAINNYFSSYEDSEEIVADIEGRIAEIFLEKLQDDKQVISKEDIEALIQTMGAVADFEAMEEEEDFTATPPKFEKKEKKKKTSSTQGTGKKRLERDTQRQLLGGVSSGIAYYLNTDPIWIRGAFIFFFIFGGLSVIVYPILWIVLPGNDALPENDSVRKLYRDPDDGVIAGVSGGLGKYFNTDPLIFRILFIVFTIGGGFGLITYIVLWIITPKANSLTDRMQMKGEKVTISNIDSNIKKNKQEELNPKDENTFTKVLLFPFRLIGRIFSGLGRVLGPLMLFIVAAIRVFVGAIISIIGISVMFSLIVSAGVLFGLYNGDWFWIDPDLTYFPYEVFENTIPGIGVLFLLVAIFIPFLYLFIAGITVIAKKRVMTSSFGWSLLGIWIISVFGTFAVLPNVVRDFRDDGVYRESDNLSIAADTLLIKVERVETDYESFYDFRSYRSYEQESEFADLDIRPGKEGILKVDKRFRARGRNPIIASENAQSVEFNFRTDGDEVIFDSDIQFPKRSKFYFQEVDVDLFIPANQPFKIDRSARDLIGRFYSRSWSEIFRNVWMYNDEYELVCLTCDEEEQEKEIPEDNQTTKVLEEYSAIQLYRNFDVEFIAADEYKMEISGPSFLIDDVNVNSFDQSLEVRALPSSGNSNANWNRVKIKFYGKTLEKLNLRNGVTMDLKDFDEEYLMVRIYDDSRLNVEGRVNELEIFAFGTARTDLAVNADKVKLVFSDESRVYAYDSKIREAEVQTESEARVRLTVSEYLTAGATGFSSIRYKGEPELQVRDKSRSASISKY
jgi:phage shock protein PspC (stress-responsive transcriptional regulator)